MAVSRVFVTVSVIVNAVLDDHGLVYATKITVKETQDPLNVHLVVQTMPLREELLRAYKFAFRDVTFFEFVPRKDISTDFQMKTLNGQRIARCDQDHRMRYHFWCLAPMLQTLAAETPSTDGILYLHMDMWIHPHRLVSQQDSNKIWRLGQGLLSRNWQTINTECLEYPDQTTQWFWWEDSLNAGFSAVQNASQDLLRDMTNLRLKARVCNGWSDMYYLPRAAWGDFRKLTQHFGGVFHEAALPTMFDFLVRFKGHQEKVLNCWGCCQCGPATLSDLHENMCGHRMDLRVEEDRAALVQLIHNPE